MRSFLLGVYAALLLTACDRHRGGDVIQAGDPQRDTLIIDGETPSCTACLLEVGQPVTLGLPTDEHIPRRVPGQILRDQRGTSYLAFHGWSDKQILRYDSTGRLLGRVGRNGDGPGEYRMTSSAYIGPGDSLHVYGDRRLSIYDAAGKFMRSFRPEMGVSGGSPVGVTRSGTTFFKPRAFGEERPAVVLRMNGSGEVIDSFPIFSPRIGWVTEWRSGQKTWRGEQRVRSNAVVGADGSVWTFTDFGDRLERHRADGVPDMVLGIQRDSMPRPLLTELEADSVAAIRRNGPEPRRATAEESKRLRTAPRTKTSLAIDSTGLLWVLRTVPAPSYDTIQLNQIDMSKTEAPGEFVLPRDVEDRRSHTVVEVIDPRQRKLIARTTLPFLGMLAAPGFVGRVTQNEEGFYITSMYPVRLRR